MRPVPRQTLVGYALVLLFLRGPLQLVVGSFTALGRGGVGLRKLERLGFEMRESAEEAEPAGGMERNLGLGCGAGEEVPQPQPASFDCARCARAARDEVDW